MFLAVATNIEENSLLVCIINEKLKIYYYSWKLSYNLLKLKNCKLYAIIYFKNKIRIPHWRSEKCKYNSLKLNHETSLLLN